MEQREHTILVVDDDPLLRMHVVELLIDAGYLVLEAQNTDAALDVLEKTADVRLLFTDVQMPPGANGLELAETVQERWPHIVLLVASGGINLTNDNVPDGGEFVAKPYPDEAIIAQIARLIAAAEFGR